MICKNLSREGKDLTFVGRKAKDLAKKYKTPLILMDEALIRERMRIYRDTMKEAFSEDAMPLYAGKAAAITAIFRIAKEEKIGLDVVSPGEIATALKAGFPLKNAYFQGNNKTDEDIAYAVANRIGAFVVDNFEEVDAIEKEAAACGIRQKILLRLTPGIDSHTYEAVNTGKVDSKFGTAIETGQAKEIVKKTLALPHIDLAGFHCHVGSLVFESSTFLRSAEIMLCFMDEIRKEFGYTARELDLGGGYGVRYTESDPEIDIAANIREVAFFVKRRAKELSLPLPAVRLEPGRSIVADAGLTLYTVGSVKRITGYKNYVSVDGGMTDNPRFALYGSKYTVFAADKMDEKPSLPADLVGRCCESGDVIQPAVLFPESIRRGDLVAVCTTGAYNYSMASHYNRVPKPAVVLLSEEEEKVIVRRETAEDMTAFDL